MTALLNHIVVLLNQLIARVSDEDVTAAFWRIILTLISLAYWSLIIYWLLRLMEVLHKIGLI